MYLFQKYPHILQIGIIISLFVLWHPNLLQAQGLIVNEMSQGESGGQKEFVELVVVGDPCTTVDLRGWILDDNNGDFTDCPGDDNGALSGTGIAAGHIRFKEDPIWEEVPVGTIILVYADNPSVPAEQADIGSLAVDYDDSNCDYLRVVPINASNTHMEYESDIPMASNGGSNNVCPNGSNGSPFYTPATYVPLADNTFLGHFQFRNGGDACQVRQDDGSYFHGIAYGTSASGSPDLTGGPDDILITFAGSGSNRNYFFDNGISDDYTDGANYLVGTATTDQSPGFANSCLNAAWIESLRTAPDDEFQGAGCPDTGPPTTICANEEVILSLTGCDSDSYLWTVNNGNATIVGANDGKSVTIVGANAGSAVVSVTATNTYSDIYTGLTGCSASAQDDVFSFPFTINAPTTPIIDGTSFCTGGSSVLTLGSAYTQYMWSNGGTMASTSVNTAGTYTVTVTDGNGCTATDAITLVENTPPTVDIENNPDTDILEFCEADGTFLGATLSGNGPYNYIWSTGETANIITVNGDNPGIFTFTVTVTDGTGCTGTDEVDVEVIPLPTANPVTIEACEDTPGSGIATGVDLTEYHSQLNSNPNVDIEWFDGDLNTFTFIDDPEDVELPPSSGTLSVDIIDDINVSDCFISLLVPYTILSTSALTVNGNDFCGGESTTLSVTETFDDYVWSNGDVGQSISVDEGGVYTVTITNASDCTSTATIAVSESPIIAPTVNGNDFCAGENAPLSVSETYNTYNWSNGDAGQSISVNITGTYTVTVEDSNGCSGTGEVTVNEIAALVPTVNGNDFCSGTNALLSVTETYDTYTWSNSNTGQSITVNTSGTYTVTVEDSNGCSGTGEVTVNEIAALVPTLNGGNFCAGTSALLSVTETYDSYTWSNGDAGQSITVNATDTYTVTVEDSNGCTGTAEVAISEVPPFVVTVNGDDFCAGTDALLSVTETYDTYTWSNSDTGQSITVNTIGTYTVTVEDTNGCTGTGEVTINELAANVPTLNGSDFCGGENTTLSVTETYDTYTWSNSDVGQSISINVAGTYTVTVTNTDGCTNTGTVAVNEFPELIPTVNGNNFCLGTSTTLSVTEIFNSYDWSNGDAGQNITVSTTGTYTVTVGDTNGCTGTGQVVVNEFGAITPTVNGDDFCTGSNTSLAVVETYNNYNWSNGDSGQNITVNAAGTYTVTVTNNDGCTGTSEVSVSETSVLSPTVNGNDFCEGSSTTLSLNTTYDSYDWSNGDAGQSISVSIIGTYTVTVEDANGCTGTGQVTVNQLPDLVPTVNGNDFCVGTSSTLSVTETYDTYNWSNGDAGQSIDVTLGGTYTVSVVDAGGCTGTGQVTIGVIPALFPTVNGSDFCAGGTAPLSVTETYDSYNWSNGDSGQNISVNQFGTYTVTVQDASGCTGTGEVSINVLPALFPTVNGSDFCAGETAPLSVTETYTSYNWSNGDSGQNISVNQFGTYTVTVEDANGCTGTGEVTINVLPALTPTVNGDDFCAGSNSTLSVIETYTDYDWSNGDSGQNISVNTAGTYTVTVEDANGCTGTGEVTINVTSSLSPTVNGSDFCAGTNTTLFLTGTYDSYDWSNGDAGQSISVNTPGTYTVTVEDASGCTGTGEVAINELPALTPTTNGDDFCAGETTTLSVTETYTTYDWSNGDAGQNIDVSIAGTYTVTVEDTNGCTGTSEVTVNELPSLTPTVSGNDFCAGETTNLFVTETYDSYDWSNGNAGQSINVKLTGTYTVTVEDANGCTGTGEVTVNELPELIPTVNGDDFCVGTSSTLAVIETYTTYDWSNGDSGQNISVTTSGTYTVTVEDANGCIGTGDVTINEATSLSPTINGSDFCAGTNATLFLTGTYDSYDWSNGDAGQSISVNTQGTYTVTVEDASGCTGTGEVTINELPNLTPTANGNDFCGSSNATLSVTETYTTYNWSNGDSGQNIDVNIAGTYTVTVEDANGCTGTDEVTINQLAALNPTVNGDDFCGGTNTNLSVTETYTTYDWSNGDSGQNIDVSIAGTYTVTVEDASGCTGTGEITVNELAALTPTTNGDDFCAGENTTLSVTETYTTYDWSNGDSGQNIDVNIAGTYTVTVEDANGCTGTGETTVSVLPALTPTANGNDFCAGENTTLSVTETYTTYDWSNGDSGQNIDVNIAGTYTVTVEDANGCTGTADVIVNQLPDLAPTVNGDNFCVGSSTTLSVTESYANYNWSNGDSGQNIDVSIAGTYTVTVEDAGGCVGTGVVTVSETTSLTPAVNGNDFCVGTNTTLTVPGTYQSYNWSNGDSGQNIDVNIAGTYTVTVEDATGCVGTGQVTVNELSAAAIPTLNGDDFCIGFNTTLSVVEVYDTYNWSNGDSGQNIDVNTVGTYTVTVSNTDGCTATNEVTIQNFVTPNPIIAGEDLCEGGSATLSVTESFETYNWSNGDVLQNITVDMTGTYTVTVSNTDDCTATSEFTVNLLTSPDPIITGALIFCEGENTSLTVSETFVEYSWSTDETSQSITVDDGGIYIVTVTNNDGCKSETAVSVAEKPLPTVSFTDNGPVCVGDEIVLTFELTGTAPWSLNYFNGSSNVTENIPSSPHTITIAAVQSLVINLNSISDADCTSPLFESTEVIVNTPPTVSNIEVLCDDTNTTYTVSFDLSEGDSDSYDVVGLGTLVGNTFTSDPIDSGDSYNFSVDDGNFCGPVVVEGSHNCNCVTFAGTMPLTPIQVCENEIIAVTNNGDETLDGDDVLQYILHSNVGPSMGTIFAQNDDGSFVFGDATPPLSYNTTYYISAIAGSDDGSGDIDLADECLSVAAGTPISFLQNPTPTAEEGGSTCGNNWDLVAFPTVGNGTWTANPATGVTFGGINDASTTVTITDEGDYTFTWTEDNNGCIGSTSVAVTFSGGITVDAGSDDEVCNDEYDLEADSGGIAGMWTAEPAAGVTFTNDTDPTTRVEVADAGIYTFTWTVDDGGECIASDAVEITFYDSISATNRDHICTDNEFVVTFEINGGDGNYLVNGSTDGLVGNVFTSEPFTSGTEYSFTITDGSPCFNFTLIDDFFCNCTTNAGILPLETIENCGFDATVSVTAANPTLDSNDILVYVLHDGTDPLNILMSNTDGQFTFDDAILDYETTYFITALAGNDDNGDGFPDSEHACYETSNDTPVVFYGQPTATVTDDCGLTQSLAALLQTATGTTAWNSTGVWTFTTTGTGSVNFDDDTNPTTDFTATEAGDYTFIWTGAGVCLTNVSTTLIEPLSASWTAECSADLLTYNVTLTIEGGTTPYVVNNVPLVGSVLVETFNAEDGFSFDIDDNGVCEAINIAGTWDCNCPSPANPTPIAAEVTYCEGETVPNLEVTDNGVDSYFWYNDPSDPVSIFEGAVFTPSIGTATYWVQAVSTEGCVSNFVSIDLVENPMPNNPIGNDETYCEGDVLPDLMVNENAALTYLWYADTTAASLFTGAIFSPSMAGTYWVQAVSSDGCESGFAEIELIQNPNPDNPTGTNQVYCAGDAIPTLIVSDNGVDSYFWYADTTATFIENGASFTPSMAGTYWVQAVSGDGCVSDFVELELIENEAPPAPTVEDVTVCEGVLLTNPIESTTAGGTLNWSADTGASGTGTFDGSGFAIGAHIITVFEESTEGCEGSIVSFVLNVEDCSQVCPTVTSAPTTSFENCGQAERTLEITLNDPDNTLERIEWILDGTVVATDVTSINVNEDPTGCDPTVLIYTANIYCSNDPNSPILAGTFDLTFYPLADATITVLNGGCTVQAQPTCPNFSIVGDDTVSTTTDGDNSTVVFTVQNDDTTLGDNCMTTVNANFDCVITDCPTIGSINAGASICVGDDISLTATINDPNGKLDRVEWLDESGTVISTDLDFVPAETTIGCDAQVFNYTLQIYCDDDPNTPAASNTSTWTVYPVPENIVEVGGCSLEVTDVDCGGALEIVYSNDGGTTWLPSPNDTPVDGEVWIWEASVVGAPDGCNLSGEVTAVCDCTPPQTPIAVSSQLIEICEGEVIPTFEVMLIDGDFTAWYDVATGGEAIAQGVTFAPVEAGIYYAEIGNNDDDCVSERVAFELVINPLDDASFAYASSLFCLGDISIPVPSLVTTPGGTFSATNGLDIDPTTGAFDLGTVSEPNTFTITYTTAGACSDTQSIDIEVGNNELVLDAGEDIEVCEGETISLNAVLQGTADLEWSFNGATVDFTDPLSLISDFIAPDTGLFTLYLTAANACGEDAQDSLQVSITPSVFVDIEGDTDITEGETTTLEAISDETTDFIWFSNTGTSTLSCTDCPNPEASPFVNTTYFVTSSDLCADTASITIQVRDVQGLTIAVENAFSPNRDGMNDEFIVAADGDLAQFNIMIFNRWGVKVFESDNINERWDGIHNDEAQPIGVYAYVITYQFEGESTKTKAGNVTIIR